MGSRLIKLGQVAGLAPGESSVGHWNNATPSDAVWDIQAIPLASSFKSSTPPSQHVQVEVTRVWRRLNRKQESLSEVGIDTFLYEHEVWWELENVGPQPVDADVYASIERGGWGVSVQHGGNVHVETGETADKQVTWKPLDGKPKNILAEIALDRVVVHGDETLAIARIDKVVSTEAGTETNPTAIIRRNGVSEVVFTLLVNDGAASARWMVHEYSSG